jgi:diketogulonate reductase-like aldo/keto reductase
MSPIPTHPFGATGVDVPVIGQGTWQIDSGNVAALRLGIDLGLTHIDTAELYTGSEEAVAGIIQEHRSKIFLVSKVRPSNASYRGTVLACEASLRRLKTDYLDAYLLHWWTGAHPIAETMEAMEELVAAGKVRYIGVSNLNVEQLKTAQKALSREKISCNQILYHLRSRGIENSLVPYCESQSIAVVGYSPFGQGDFPSPKSAQGQVLAAIATKHGRTARQVALNFLTRRKSLFAIPKSGDPQHVRENAGGVGWKLDDSDVKLIDRAFPLPRKDEPLDMI